MTDNRIEEAGVQVHPMAAAFPLISGHGRDQLVVDITAHGVVIPIVWSADGAELIDGRNRLDVWLYLGRDLAAIPSVRLGEDVDPIEFIVSANLARRQMNTAQKALTAARSMPIFMAAARLDQLAGLKQNRSTKNCGTGGGEAAERAGVAFGVNREYVNKARLILDYPAIADMIDSGDINIPQALQRISELRETTIAKVAKEWDLRWCQGDPIVVDATNFAAMRELTTKLVAEMRKIDNLDYDVAGSEFHHKPKRETTCETCHQDTAFAHDINCPSK